MTKSRSKLSVVTILAAVFTIIAGAALWAQSAEKPSISLKIEAEKIVVKKVDGKEVETKVPATEVEVGDVLVYTLTYKNEGKTPAMNVGIVDPIPEATIYEFGSVEGKGTEITFSINGGQGYRSFPITYTKATPDGGKEQVEASADMYTHIKWFIKGPIAPGESGVLTYRAKAK